MNPQISFSVSLQRYWLFGLLIAIPFSLTYVTNSSAAISYLNIFSVIFILLGVFNMVTKQVPVAKIADKKMLAVIGLLLLALLFALFFTHPLRNGIGFWISRLLQPLLVGYFTYQLLAIKAIKIEQLIQALLASLGLLVIGGLLQFLHIIPYKDSLTRITVTYQWPNTFARYVEILLLLSLPYIWFKVQKNRIWFFGLWITGFLLLLASLSYNGVVTCVIALIVFLLLLPKSYRKIQVSLLVFITIIGILTAINAPKLPKWQRSINDSRVTRLQFWEIAGGAIKDNFWTGIGIKGWETRYPELLNRYATGRHLSETSQQPHNVFLDSLLKAGPLGLVAVLGLLLWPIYRGYRLFKESPLSEYGWFGLSIMMYGIALLLFGFIDDPLWSDDTMPILYILFFAAAYAITEARSRKKSLS